jgi:hypothetical protein
MQKLLIIFVMMMLMISCDKTEEPVEEDTLVVTLDPVSSINEGDDDYSLPVTVRLSKPSAETQVVLFQTIDGSAEGGSDFKAMDNFPLEFIAGDIQNELMIEIYGDEAFEEDESFVLRVVYPEKENGEFEEISITILNDDRDTTLFIPESGFVSPATYAGMDLIWEDNFNPEDDLEEYWTFEYGGGGWGNNESQYYKKENTRIHEDGYLVIEARKELYLGKQYTSSRIITKNKFEFKYGRVDIRAALPYGQGLWPALWMLGENIFEVGWPACGEIDIMELLGQAPATTHGTIHWDQYGEHAMYGGKFTLNGSTFHDEFHVFSIIWDEQKIQWLVDGLKYHEADITPAQLSEFHNDYFFIFNVAVGGNWPGYPDDSTEFPQRMIVDYIRVFQ